MLTQLKISSQKQKGFTLLEMLAALATIGVIAAIAMPSFLGWMNKTRIDQSTISLKKGFQVAQRQASRTARRCRVNVDITSKEIGGVDPDNNDPCLNELIELSNYLQITTNDPDIVFSPKGNAFINDPAVFVITMADNDHQRCIVIFPGVGIIKSGVYNGDPAIIDEDNCDFN